MLSPVRPVPEPGRASSRQLRLVLAPAVLAELTLDNRASDRPRRVFFGYQGSDPCSAMRYVSGAGRIPLHGVSQGLRTGVFVRDRAVSPGTGFNIESLVAPAVEANRTFGLGPVAALTGIVPPGKKISFRFAVCFFRHGPATAGLKTRYCYTRLFKDIEEVASFALSNWNVYEKWAAQADALLERAPLSETQKFMMAHAIRSYYGSTELLDLNGRPVWIVNEGEYRMMNTFDLTADHLFFEMRMNPWTVRNVLDMFADRYSYRDRTHFPNDTRLHPGGVSFTHDMGVANVFAPPGRSAYELFGLSGCFSHMTHEQLVNWVCCAATYALRTGDIVWLKRRAGTLAACLKSLVNRDHPAPAKRTGVMKLDSSRTLAGAEITTYDSLDASLGQARNNLYLAVKTWAAYVLLERIFGLLGKPSRARTASRQAEACANTIAAHATGEGWIPAVMDEPSESRIIPAIEGLVFPWFAGCREALDENGRFSTLVRALRRHIETVLKPGICLFPDNGWKMSSTSENSWLSKIYLCQFVAREILGLRRPELYERADEAHAHWLLRPESAYWSWSDQIVSGIARGSKYYPRGVTSILWLSGNPEKAGRREASGRWPVPLRAPGGKREPQERALHA